MVALAEGLLCVGLADDRLRSNALLGATAELERSMLCCLGGSPAAARELQRSA